MTITFQMPIREILHQFLDFVFWNSTRSKHSIPVTTSIRYLHNRPTSMKEKCKSRTVLDSQILQLHKFPVMYCRLIAYDSYACSVCNIDSKWHMLIPNLIPPTLPIPLAAWNHHDHCPNFSCKMEWGLWWFTWITWHPFSLYWWHVASIFSNPNNSALISHVQEHEGISSSSPESSFWGGSLISSTWGSILSMLANMLELTLDSVNELSSELFERELLD